MTELFQNTPLHPKLLDALVLLDYMEMTPIQAQAIPIVLQGKDVMGMAQTGTGKTAAFSLPLLHHLIAQENSSASPARHSTQAIVLTPTRELAEQVFQSIKRYGQNTLLRMAAIYGGVDMTPQLEQLRLGVEIVVSTPGRLLDHLQAKSINLSQVQFVVLDEADRMLDIGFLPDLERILTYLPKSRQTLLFSATFSNDIRKLAKSYLKSPSIIEVSAPNTTASTIEQWCVRVEESTRLAQLLAVLDTYAKQQVLIFVNRKTDASRITRNLQRAGWKADALHGDIAQVQRLETLAAFKSGDCQLLIATDVAARGLDIEALPLVINYELPHHAEDYVHRIGRTGRAGADGFAISLMSELETRKLSEIEALIKRQIPQKSALAKRTAAKHDADTRHFPAAKRPSAAQYTPASKIDSWFMKPYAPETVSASTVAIETTAPLPTQRTIKAEQSAQPIKHRVKNKSKTTKVAALLKSST